MSHQFIFSPGIWIGEGRILFSSSPESVRFYMRWTVEPQEKGRIIAKQQIEIHGVQDNILNTFTFSSLSDDKFNVQLENDLVGAIKGHGVLDAKSIGWEFRSHPTFEGFETCCLEENGDYMIHAEYASASAHRTVIDGRVWKKAS
jgi:hypothetical protein